MLFIPHKSHPTEQSLQLLAALLHSYNLPEKHTLNRLDIEEVDASSEYPLRMQLLHWLLPTKQVEDGRESHIHLDKVTNIRLKAQILIALSLRNSQKVTYSEVVHVSVRSDEKEDKFQAMADCYMSTTFNTPVGAVKTSVVNEGFFEEKQVSCVSEIKSAMLKLLRKGCQHLMQLTELNVSTVIYYPYVRTLLLLFH